MTAVTQIPEVLSPDNVHKVLIDEEDMSRLVLSLVYTDGKKTPCGIVKSCYTDSRKGLKVQDVSEFLRIEHKDSWALMSLLTQKGTTGWGKVCKLMCKLPDNPHKEAIPGSYMHLATTTVSNPDLLPPLFERLALEILQQYRTAIAMGMPRPGMPFDAEEYRECAQVTYLIERLNVGMGTHRIVRRDSARIQRADWLFLQKFLNFTCDKPPRQVSGGAPNTYVIKNP